MRPFRFLATVEDSDDNRRLDLAGLTALVRKAEAVGCDTFVLPDHLLDQPATLPLLAMVAALTETMRVSPFVLNVCLRHPAVLAQELATIDALSGGRLDVALGAGWNRPEHDAVGIPFDPTGARIKRLTEAIAVLKGCFGDGPFDFAGEYYTISGYDALPKPAQRPHPPIFLGGGGRRILTLAGREARIVGLAPRIKPIGGEPRTDAWSLTVEATEEKIGWIRDAAGDRFDEIELNTYPTGGPVLVTHEPRVEAARRAARIRERTGVELTVDQILDSPHIFLGTHADLRRKFLDLRERCGISSFLVDDLDALAPVIEDLAGR
jgi:probable F420-dependent oxidoreductase